MRLQLILPHMKPTEYEMPLVYPYEYCQGRHFQHHQEVDKPVKDTSYEAVSAQRYKCSWCKWTFRVYRRGVVRIHTSL